MSPHPVIKGVSGPLFISDEGRRQSVFLAKEDALKLARDLERETGEAFAVISHDYMSQSGYRTYTVERA